MRSFALLVLSLLLGRLHVHATMADSSTSDSCCALCISQSSDSECSSSSSGRLSCANATTQAPSLVTGEALEVSAGQWIQLSWPHVHRVTYEVFADTANITRTVTNSSHEALRAEADGSSRSGDGEVFFRICAAEQGVVLVRGWGEDACSTTTPQYEIQVRRIA